ncbi:MAG TPA: MOSC N-terminal beta barrel domain-containing protein [Jiangellaceae bacterium]
MRVASLHVYPVKSTRGVDLTSAFVEPWGLAGDRRWMVVDEDDRLLTAREEPRLLTVAARALGDGALTVTGPHAAPLSVAGASGEVVPVQVWNDVVPARHPGPHADTWFGALLGREVRLVWLDDPTRRDVNPLYGRPGDHVSFADAYPLHLTTTASLRQLNDWIGDEAVLRGEPTPVAPLPMRRFRPSVVIDTAVPFDEDRWTRLRIGSVAFRAVKGCDRCVLTTIDPDTLESGREPIRTLARHRRWNGKVWFGVNLVPDGLGTVSVGDEVTLLT